MKVGGRHIRSIWLEPDGHTVSAIDQRRLPHHFVVKQLGHELAPQAPMLNEVDLTHSSTSQRPYKAVRSAFERVFWGWRSGGEVDHCCAAQN